MRYRRLNVVVGLALVAGAGIADPIYTSCRQDGARHRLRAEELLRIEAADQDDRPNNSLKPGAQERDRQRRERVGAIFGEGCLLEARDFAAAALVFQHGDQPEHFFQTFLWSKRAVELGDASQRGMMARGIDRYLVNTGHQQLFATQYFRPSLQAGTCWCLEPTEASFPDGKRVDFNKQTYQQSLEYLKVLNTGLSCPLAECARNLNPSPAGTVPGFW